MQTPMGFLERIPGPVLCRLLLRLALLAVLSTGLCGLAQAADQLYLSTYGDSVQVVNATTGDGVGAIMGSGASNLMALTPDRKTLFVAGGDKIRAINTTSNALIAEIPHRGSSGYIEDLVVSSDYRLYASDCMAGKVVVYDARTYALVRNISTYVYRYNGNPADIAVSPDGARLYVAHCISGEGGNLSANQYNVTVFDAATGDVLVSKRFDTIIHAMALSPDGSLLYVATRNFSGSDSYRITRMRAGDLSRPNTRAISDSYPRDMIVAPDGRVYVSEDHRGSGGAISVLNRDATAVLQTIAVGPAPDKLSLSPDGKRIYTATRNGVSTVALETGAVGGFATGWRVYDVEAIPRMSVFYFVPLQNLTLSPTPTAPSGPSITPVPLPTDPTATPTPTEDPAASPVASGATDTPSASPEAVIPTPGPTAGGGDPTTVPAGAGTPTATPTGGAMPAPGFGLVAVPLGIALAALIVIGPLRRRKL